jgi:CBS domain-containing protein
MPKTAADVMERGVVSVSPETSLIDVLRLFVEEGIHGAPVIGDDGSLVGVVSSTDLLRAVSEEHESAGFASNRLFQDVLEFGPPAWTLPEDFQDRLSGRRVSEVMTEGAVYVDESTRAREVAEQMQKHRIHRVWVVGGGRLTGVVSSFDLLPLVRDE